MSSFGVNTQMSAFIFYICRRLRFRLQILLLFNLLVWLIIFRLCVGDLLILQINDFFSLSGDLFVNLISDLLSRLDEPFSDLFESVSSVKFDRLLRFVFESLNAALSNDLLFDVLPFGTVSGVLRWSAVPVNSWPLVIKFLTSFDISLISVTTKLRPIDVVRLSSSSFSCCRMITESSFQVPVEWIKLRLFIHHFPKFSVLKIGSPSTAISHRLDAQLEIAECYCCCILDHTRDKQIN